MSMLLLFAPAAAAAVTDVIKSVGTGRDYANLGAFQAYLNSISLISLNIRLIAEVYEDQTVTGLYFDPNDVDDTHYCIIRPATGLGINASDSGALTYGTTGIELTADTSSYVMVNNGISIEGFRIRITGASTYAQGHRAAFVMAKYNQTGGNSSIHQFRHCRFKIECLAPVVENGNSGAEAALRDCLVVWTSTAGVEAYAWTSYGARCYIERNTFVSLGHTGSAIYEPFESKINNNVFVGLGARAVNHFDWSNSSNSIVENNFSDYASDAGVNTGLNGTSGWTVDTTANALLTSSTDFRPTAAGPLIGAATTAAANTLDVRQLSRGASPDVGAVEYVAVTLTNRRAMILASGILKELPTGQEGTGKKPIVLLSGALQERSASEGLPVVNVSGVLRTLATDETLVI